MTRTVQCETLDVLDPQHVLAKGSRADLRRINAIMRHRNILLQALSKRFVPPENRPLRWAELGCGDGTLVSFLARNLAGRWPRAQIWLVDQSPVIHSDSLRTLRRCGWEINVVQAEATHWLDQADGPRLDLILCNLFLHHFAESPLRCLLHLIHDKANGLVACEPRRSSFSLAGALLLGLIGCNRVTRQDALISVRAGFQAHELSRLWPDKSGWELKEHRVGWFSHLLAAQRFQA